MNASTAPQYETDVQMYYNSEAVYKDKKLLSSLKEDGGNMRTYAHRQACLSFLLRYKTPSRRNASENRLFSLFSLLTCRSDVKRRVILRW